MAIYKPENFRLEEFVPKDVHMKFGEICWEFLDQRMLISVQQFRNYIGKSVRLNDWFWGGRNHHQCFRDSSYYDDIRYSQHLHGRASDPSVEGFDADELREIVKKMKKAGELPYVTRMEIGVSWLHIDTAPCERPNDDSGLFLFNPYE